MKLNINIGELADSVEEYKNIKLVDNHEIDISELRCQIETPSGLTRINYIIKKENLKGIKITLDNGVAVKCANKHILRSNNTDVYADSLASGDYIQTNTGEVEIVGIEAISDTTFYDIGIAAPYLYYDDQGILHHNTIITAALSLSVEENGRSIIIVPNKSLVTQTEADYINLGLDVGVYFGDRKEYGKTHTICTWQSLNNILKGTAANSDKVEPITISEFIEGVVCVIVDECHGAKSEVMKTLLTTVFSETPIRWGLTGTIPKEDYAAQSITCSLGPVVGALSAKELQDTGHLANCHVNIVQIVDHVEYKDYQSELKYLTETPGRVAFIARMIEKIKESGNTLILVDRIATGNILQAELSTLSSLIGEKPDITFVKGSMKAKDRKEEYDDIATATNKITIATYGVAAVGINVPRIFNLVLFEPGKSFVRVIQSIGRGIRKANDKDEVMIWDLTSTCKFSKRHLTARKKFYNDASYPFSIEKVSWQ